MNIPSLKTDRLELLPPSKDSFETYKKFYTDPVASKMYGGPITEAQAWTRLQSDIGSWHLQGFGVWSIREKETGKTLGVCGFWKGHEWPPELTFWLLPEARGKAYAFEASKAAIRYAYQELKWDEVQTYYEDHNLPVKKLVGKLGGRLKLRRVFPDGKERNIYLFPKP